MKPRLLLSLFGAFMLKLSAMAGDGNYAVSAIPDTLLKNANVVKRFEEYRFTIRSTSRASLYHRYVITILNEKGDKFARATEIYDKLQEVDYIDGTLYDAMGKKIKSLKKADIKDFSGTGEGTLADDSRVKFHSFYYKVYPYTVEYEVSLNYNFTMFFPKWSPVDDEFVAVEYSKMQVICPADYVLRYKAFNYQQQPARATEKGNTSYTWEAKALPAIQDEYARPAWPEVAPFLYLGPSAFSVQDYSGNMSSWQDFGKMIYALKRDRDQLPENIRKTVHQLTEGISDPRQKIARLYRFMQDNTRYISIQLGIGGWQPFDATYVANRKYGDCKALTNYMYALLKEAGIRSNYTLIKSGPGNTFFVPDFPSSQFNHVILSVPLQKDTVWLECTSQTLPAGYLSGFTSDRYALAIDENGGTLVRTPVYGLKDNLEIRNTKATLDEQGTLHIEAITSYKGIQQDELYDRKDFTREKIMDALKAQIDLPQFDVMKYDYSVAPSVLPEVKEILQLKADNYAQFTGKRLFIAPNMLTKTRRRLAPDDSRKYAVQLSFAYTDIDTAEITLPQGYKPEALPAPVSIESPFGKFSSRVIVEGDKIRYYRSLESYSGRFPPAAYNELVKFREQIYKSDRTNAVFVKKEG